MTAAKVFTVRLSAEEARLAEILARAGGVSLNEVFRSALSRYVEHKRGDADFVAKAKAMIERDAEIVSQII